MPPPPAIDDDDDDGDVGGGGGGGGVVVSFRDGTELISDRSRTMAQHFFFCAKT